MMWIIHIICLIFFLPVLIITIPLHLILNASGKSSKKEVVFISKEEYEKKNSRPKGFELGRL
jgi:hypothetical protein